MDRFSDEALVLSTVDFGEADRIVTLFTRGHGRLSAFAAGARKSKRRFAGALEVDRRKHASSAMWTTIAAVVVASMLLALNGMYELALRYTHR